MTAAAVVPRPPGDLLPAAFFARSPDTVAPDLIGKIIWRQGVGGGRLVEVEAYLAEGDPASHAFRGPTQRNRAMFGPPGTIYLFVSYGVHVLLNLVCEAEGVGAAVLIRAFEPVGRSTTLLVNRGLESQAVERVASGPGRLGRALGLDLRSNHMPLGPASGICVIDDGLACSVEATPRIGISSGQDLPLRYILPGSASLSAGPRHGRKVRR